MPYLRVFKHHKFRHPSALFTHWRTDRYTGITGKTLASFGLNEEITSIKLTPSQIDYQCSVMLFDQDNFEGNFRVFIGNDPVREIENLSSVKFNDKTKSIVLVNHASQLHMPFATTSEHIPIPLGAFRDVISDYINEEIKKGVRSRGVEVQQRGAIKLSWSVRQIWGYNRMVVKLTVRLKVGLAIIGPIGDWYDAEVRYFLYPYVDRKRNVRVIMDHWHVWVEGGLFSGTISSELVKGACSDQTIGKVQNELNTMLDALNTTTDWDSCYLMPGDVPVYGWTDYEGHTDDDVALILVT